MKYVRNILLLVVVCLALHYFGIVDFRQLATLDHSVVLRTLVPCTLLLLVVNSLAAVRWVLIVNRFLGTRIDVMTGMALTFKSGLFSYFLPGQIGSELSRVILAARGGSPNDLNHAVSAAIIDRAVALVSQLIMAGLFLAFALLPRQQSPGTVPLLLGGGLLLSVVLLLIGNTALKSAVFAFKSNRYVDYVGNILKMVKTFVIAQPVFCGVTLLCSMLLNLAVAYVIYLIVSRIIHPMDFSTVALMSLVSNLSSVIPITPGGVGISEMVFRETGALVENFSVANLAGGYILFRLLNIGSYTAGMLLLGIARLGLQARKPTTATL